MDTKHSKFHRCKFPRSSSGLKTLNTSDSIFINDYIYVCAEVNNGVKFENIEENWQSNSTRRKDFSGKESQHYSVSVLINHHQNWEGWY